MRNAKNISRRSMLTLAGLAGAGTLLAGCSSGTTAKAPSAEPSENKEVSLNVYDPTGNIQIQNLHAPRLDTLDGKTIAFVSDDAWEDDRTFAEIKRILGEKYPNTKVITQENFIHGIANLTKDDNGVPEQLIEANVDAAIVGNAG